MKKILIPLMLLPTVLSIAFCSSSDSKQPSASNEAPESDDNTGLKFYGITREEIGVQKNNTISFYQCEEFTHKWSLNPDKDFTVPKDAKQIFMSYDGEIGIFKKDGAVEFYKITGPKVWQQGTRKTFTVSKDYERVLPYGDRLGFVKGNTIDFYINAAPVQQLKFTAPDSYTSLFNSGGEDIVVGSADGLNFYHFSNGQWLVEAHTPYPTGKKNILPIQAYPGVAFITDKTIDIYKQVDNELTQEYAFVIPK